MDVSWRSLELAKDKLRLDEMPERQRSRIELIQGSLNYRDQRIAGFDSAAVVEVTGIEKGEYARVKSMDAPNNLLTVVRADGSEQTYDPRRQQGVSIYKEQEKVFSVGDRIQFTAPANELKIANRELGTIQSVTDDGRMALKMDTGRSVSIDPRDYPHLDHGYAVTSHSSQGRPLTG